MHCDIYKFPKHSEMYVYIARPDSINGSDPETNDTNDTYDTKDSLAVLPKALRQSLGEGKLLMHLDLAAKEKLARVDINEVRSKLESQGYFVQSPPADVLTARAQSSMKAAQDKKYD